MNVMAPNLMESAILLLVLACFVVVIVASLLALIYLPKISRQLNRLENQVPHGP